MQKYWNTNLTFIQNVLPKTPVLSHIFITEKTLRMGFYRRSPVKPKRLSY